MRNFVSHSHPKIDFNTGRQGHSLGDRILELHSCQTHELARNISILPILLQTLRAKGSQIIHLCKNCVVLYMQLVEENFEFEFRGAHHIKNLASKVPLTATIPTLQLVNLARKTLDSAKEEEVELWRRNLNPEMMSSEEQSASALADSPTSRFTAVNGEKPTSAGPSRRGSDERSNGQPRISPPGQEKLTITTSTPHREDWPNSERPSYQPPYSEAGSQQKRKRSGSPEHNQSSANSYDAHVQPSSAKETSTTAMIVESDKPREDNLQGLSQMRSEPRSYMHPESEYRGYINSPSADESWPRHYASQHLSPEDNNLEEALRRASQTMDSHQRQEYDPDSPGDADRSANPYSAHGYEKREMSAGSDPKKRKRNFSNRTKTGCMTCRKRKKKCDEKRPECKPCLKFDPQVYLGSRESSNIRSSLTKCRY